jgi:acetyltransferase-like isoleucine patch superfamily enzyme
MRATSSVWAVRSANAIQRLRIAWYRRHWTCAEVHGSPTLLSPAILAGAGKISFDGGVALGWELSPGFLAGYTYIEARYEGSSVTIGEGTHINNGATIVSEGPGITLGRRCLVGLGVHIYDSDFHPLKADERDSQLPRRAAVEIADEVFIGTNAMILKGARIGAGSVVGAGAVVAGEVAAGTIVAGNPARVVA